MLETYVHLIHYLEGQIQALERCLEKEAQKERYRESISVLGAFRGIAVSSWLARQIETRGVPADRLSVLHPGVDAAPFARHPGGSS